MVEIYSYMMVPRWAGSQRCRGQSTGWVETNPSVFWCQWDYLLTNQLRIYFLQGTGIEDWP